MKILHFFERCPMCLLQMGALRKDHSEFLHQGYQCTPKNLLLQGVTWKRGGAMNPSDFWGNSHYTQGENFSQWEQSAIGIIPQESDRFLNIGHIQDSAGQGAGPSYPHQAFMFLLCFCQKNQNYQIIWTRLSLKSPSILLSCLCCANHLLNIKNVTKNFTTSMKI